MSTQISTDRYWLIPFCYVQTEAFQSTVCFFERPTPPQRLWTKKTTCRFEFFFFWACGRGLVWDCVIEHFCHDFAVFLFSRDFAQETRLTWGTRKTWLGMMCRVKGQKLDWTKQTIRWGFEELNCESKSIAAPINAASFWSCNPSFPHIRDVRDWLLYENNHKNWNLHILKLKQQNIEPRITWSNSPRLFSN